MFRLLLLILPCAASAGLLRAAEQGTQERQNLQFFERRIRPLLTAKCLGCHGPKKQQAGLRLDSRAGILAGSAEGKVVLAGNSANSKLVQLLSGSGDLRMPPKEKLNARQISDFARWIDLGLPWPATDPGKSSKGDAWERHWSFQPLQAGPLPSLRSEYRVHNRIDRYISARLEANSLTASPPAGRRILIRRLSFDLRGLPPSWSEVHDFVNDETPQAYQRLVDRLLASPQYGERWARHWLDVARYADNKGYVFFERKEFPWAYTYRDYVIEAFNGDKPYDQFLVDQLAADQAFPDQPRRLRALGMLTVGARFMNNAHDVLDDRIDVVTRGMLGLTVACSRCHDHKFDPIQQSDYYSLYGVFRSAPEPLLPPEFQAGPDTPDYRAFQDEMRKRIGQLNKFVARHRAKITGEARQRVSEYLLAVHAKRNQPSTEEFMMVAEKGAINPAMLLRWERYLIDSKARPDPIWMPWHELSNTAAGSEFDAHLARLLKDQSDHINARLAKVLSKKKPQSVEQLAKTYGELLAEIDRRWQQEIRAAAKKPGTSPASFADRDDEQLRLVLYATGSPPMIPHTLGWGFLALIPERAAQAEFRKLLGEVEKHSVSGKGAPPRAMAVRDLPTPYEPVVFLRGNPYRKGPRVERRFIRLLDRKGSKFKLGSGRLELARAIVDPKNPLTARVIVNRVWMHHFGQPLVATPSDFGMRSTPPSHPRLLDHLATRLIQRNWSLKWLHREIVTSAVYRQASDWRADAARIDPQNRLLWRMNRRRLDFEATRDAVLSAAGNLDGRLGGPPQRLFPTKSPTRRTIYGFVDRMNINSTYRTFDFPTPVTSSPKREYTTIAPQALFFMNHPLTAQSARQIVQRLAAAEPRDRLAGLYQILYQRQPSVKETQACLTFLEGPLPPSADSRWQQLVEGLLMTNEFVFVD